MAGPRKPTVRKAGGMKASTGGEGGLKPGPPKPRATSPGFRTPQATSGRGVESQKAVAAREANSGRTTYGPKKVNKKTGTIEQSVTYEPGTWKIKPPKSSKGTRRAS